MHRGYIKLWRKISDSRLWKSEPFTRGQAWIDLIMLANHKDGYIRVRGQRVEVPRGTVGWSEVKLSDRWKWSRGKTRRFLVELASSKEQKIVQHKNFITSLIKIVNYDLYQSNSTADSTADGQQTDSRRYTNKNVKNVKNVKNTYSSDFEMFWQTYPKKIGKGAAYKSWLKIKPNNGTFNLIISAVEKQCLCDQWNRDNGQYIPNPSTWLNQSRWEDEIGTEPKDNSFWAKDLDAKGPPV